MNIFFTCKNTLVITLQVLGNYIIFFGCALSKSDNCPFQFYRLLVVQLEKKEAMREEEEKKRKALKRRTIKEQVVSAYLVPEHWIPYELARKISARAQPML